MGKPTLLEKGNIIPNPGDKNDYIDIVPIEFIMSWFKERINKFSSMYDRVLILQSDVGSGKTTVLPATLYKEFNESKPKDIIVTQPRVLTAVEKPKEMSSDGNSPWLELGKNIGYSTGPMKENKTEPGIMFQTVETLKMKLISNTDIQTNDNKIIDKNFIIIIDEVHERSIALDTTLFLLKHFLIRNIGNIDAPFLVLTSATFDRIKFAKYFLEDIDDISTDINTTNTKCSSKKENNKLYQNIINVKGSASAREFHWPEFNFVNYIDAAVDTAIKIHNDNKDDIPIECDIIIFCMDPSDITKTIELLQYKDKKRELIIIHIDGIKYKDPVESAKIKKYLKMTLSEIKKYFDQPNAIRRVYVVNVVAETGLTIRTLKYCIDSGWDKASEYNPIHGCNLLLTKPITHNAMIQRYGRVGRVFPCHFYPLYTQEIANSLQEEKYPDIITNDISDLLIASSTIVIDTKQAKKRKKVLDDELIVNPPRYLDLLPIDSVKSTYNRLSKLGLMNATMLDIIKLIPSRISIECMRMILSGYAWKCNIRDLITIATFISVPTNTLYNTMQKSKSKSGEIGLYKFDKILETFINKKETPLLNTTILKAQICDEFIETLFIERWLIRTLLKVKSFSKLHEQCNEYGLRFNAICDLLEIRDQIIAAISLAGLKVDEFPKCDLSFGPNFITTISLLKRCIYEGFKYNKITYNKIEQCYTNKTNIKFLNIKNINNIADLSENPQHILYNSILIKQNRGNWNNYVPSIDRISIMDGYIQ